MSLSVASIIKVAGAGLIGFAAVSAQPGGEQPTESARPGRRVEQPVDRATLRARLERRLEESRKSTASLEQGIQKLDGGADPMEVSRQLERQGRFSRGGGGAGEGPRDGGGRGGFRPDGPGPMDNSPITPEERESLLGMLRETMPTVAERLEKLRETDADGSERLLKRLLPKLREAASMRERDPDLYAMKMAEMKTSSDVMAAAQAFREHTGDEQGKSAARAALRDAISKHFDAREAVQGREIKQLEERLAGLKAEAARKAQGREEMIESFLKRLEEQPPQDKERGERRPPK